MDSISAPHFTCLVERLSGWRPLIESQPKTLERRNVANKLEYNQDGGLNQLLFVFCNYLMSKKERITFNHLYQQIEYSKMYTYKDNSIFKIKF